MYSSSQQYEPCWIFSPHPGSGQNSQGSVRFVAGFVSLTLTTALAPVAGSMRDSELVALRGKGPLSTPVPIRAESSMIWRTSPCQFDSTRWSSISCCIASARCLSSAIICSSAVVSMPAWP